MAPCVPAFGATVATGSDTASGIRARGFVRCAGIVRPGVAVPTADGSHWYGISADICRALAAVVFGDQKRIAFEPYFGDRPASEAADVTFLSGNELVGSIAPEAEHLTLGPAIVHDAIAILVPAGGPQHVSELAGKTVCVEPGSVSDRALTAYFKGHAIALQEHPFQETDEMRQAYLDGTCDALAGPLTTLASVRADPQEGHHTDRVLPELLADDPILAATSGDESWSRLVWWTFAALVDAERAGIDAGAGADDEPIPGVPPAVGQALHVRPTWARDAVNAGGNYGALFDRNLGQKSVFKLARGKNALWNDGGLIFALSVE